MREEGIVLLPAARGARISGTFLPFIKPCSHAQPEATMPLVKDEDRKDLSRVAERICLEKRDEEKSKHKHNNVDEVGRDHKLDEVQTDSTHTNDVLDDTDETHEYRRKLRSHTQRLRQDNSDKTVLICNITELFLQN